MEGVEHLYYALGQLAYAVAKADGEVQHEERDKLHDIVSEELANHHPGIDVSEIIFSILEKDNIDLHTTYDWAIEELTTHNHYLTDELKTLFINILEKVGESFAGVTDRELQVIERFKKDVMAI